MVQQVELPEGAELVYTPPQTLPIHESTGFCPGCGYGTIFMTLQEVLDKRGIAGDTIAIFDSGCMAYAIGWPHFNWCEAPMGRPPAVGTGIKRMLPDKTVVLLEGDSAFMGVGSSESLHAAARGENITVIVFNNAITANTGGHFNPTTPLGLRTKTSLGGREVDKHGHPLNFLELLAQLPGVGYAARVSLGTPAKVRQLRQAMDDAIECQNQRAGMSIVEILTPCPSGWRMEADEAMEYLHKVMPKVFPLGVFKTFKS